MKLLPGMSLYLYSYCLHITTCVRVCSVTSALLDSVTPWTVAHQFPLSMGFSQQENWSGLPCPPPEDLPDPEIKPVSPALQADSLLLSNGGSPSKHYIYSKKKNYKSGIPMLCRYCRLAYSVNTETNFSPVFYYRVWKANYMNSKTSLKPEVVMKYSLGS